MGELCLVESTTMCLSAVVMTESPAKSTDHLPTSPSGFGSDQLAIGSLSYFVAISVQLLVLFASKTDPVMHCFHPWHMVVEIRSAVLHLLQYFFPQFFYCFLHFTMLWGNSWGRCYPRAEGSAHLSQAGIVYAIKHGHVKPGRWTRVCTPGRQGGGQGLWTSSVTSMSLALGFITL